jgi:hypothetical protein
MGDLVEYDLEMKKQHNSITYASNYTQLKRDRVLYNQFIKKNNVSVCEISDKPRANYTSYDLRTNILRGCLYNKYTCLNTCPQIFL